MTASSYPDNKSIQSEATSASQAQSIDDIELTDFERKIKDLKQKEKEINKEIKALKEEQKQDSLKDDFDGIEVKQRQINKKTKQLKKLKIEFVKEEFELYMFTAKSNLVKNMEEKRIRNHFQEIDQRNEYSLRLIKLQEKHVKQLSDMEYRMVHDIKVRTSKPSQPVMDLIKSARLMSKNNNNAEAKRLYEESEKLKKKKTESEINAVKKLYEERIDILLTQQRKEIEDLSKTVAQYSETTKELKESSIASQDTNYMDGLDRAYKKFLTDLRHRPMEQGLFEELQPILEEIFRKYRPKKKEAINFKPMLTGDIGINGIEEVEFKSRAARRAANRLNGNY